MAISLEELALGALEGSAGPWTLAVGAGALAVALAAGSARPVRRMASTGALAGAFGSQRTGQLNLTGWIGSARQSWRDLVAEARAEYEASRRSPAAAAAAPIVLQAADRPAPVATVDTPVSPVANTPVTSPEPAVTRESGRSKRDQRGRFVRRATNNNGTRSE